MIQGLKSSIFMQFLIVTDVRFWRREMGSHIRIANMVDHLVSKGVTVDIFFTGWLFEPDITAIHTAPLNYGLHSRGEKSSGLDKEDIVKWQVTLVRNIRTIVWQVALNLRRRIFRKFARSTFSYYRRFDLQICEPKLSSFRDQKVKQRFDSLCEKLKPDILIVEYVRLAWLLTRVQEVVPIHCISFVDTHDVQYERQSRFHEMGLVHDIDITPEEEAAALALANFVIAIQSTDRNKLASLMPQSKIIVVGLAPPSQPAPRQRESRSNIIRLSFIGSAMSPNVAAAKRLICNIFQPLREKLGFQVELHIYGEVCDQLGSIQHLDGVVLNGRALSVSDVFSATDIFVNPVLTGGGLKIKNVEALSYGVVLITSTIGAEGIENGAGTAFILLDKDEEFVAAILTLIENPKSRWDFQNSAWKFASENFTEEIVYSEIDAIWMNNSSDLRTTF